MSLSGQPLTKNSDHKFLGVLIDDKLKFDKHVKRIDWAKIGNFRNFTFFLHKKSLKVQVDHVSKHYEAFATVNLLDGSKSGKYSYIYHFFGLFMFQSVPVLWINETNLASGTSECFQEFVLYLYIFKTRLCNHSNGQIIQF